MISKDFKPKIRKDIVWKEEGEKGEIISLASYLGGSIRFLNPVASRVVKLSDGKHTVQEIIDDICRTFEDTDPKVAERDVEKFLKTLEKKKIIKPIKSA
jgi:hypothetical protein